MMNHWKNIVSMMVLSGAAALAGTGCLAQGHDDEVADDHAGEQAHDRAATGAERTGDAQEACGCGGGWGPIGAGGFYVNPWISIYASGCWGGGLGWGGSW